MLTSLLAHAGQPLAPHDLWTAWNLDPGLIGLLVAAGWMHRRGRSAASRATDVWRTWAFNAGLVVVALALVSPLEPLSGVLASAHMVQHVLLMLVAAPLLAYSAPGSALMRGAPLAIRRLPGRLGRRLRLRGSVVAAASHPVVVLLLYIVTLWTWHAGTVYDATLSNAWVHVAEHATFLVAAILVWRMVLSGRHGRRAPGGVALLVIFGVAMASVLLSLLLTFAPEAWYSGYRATTAAWGLDQLEDQHLAGVLMWVPAGAIYVVTALASFVMWIRASEDPAPPIRREHP